ncbi:hypothetical protein ACP70R_036845 [Stipagrostis hirtigluma subsp. patula]
MVADVGRALPCDRLSDLPDCILVSILCRLQIDEAARCSVLSSRWRRVFPLTLLDFRAFMPRRHYDVIKAVNSILAAYPTAPVRSFHTYWRFGGDEDASAGGWLQELARRGVQELSLSFDDRDGRQSIPASLFACASLTRLRATRCIFPDPPASPLPLTHLTEIYLWNVTISDDSLHAVFSQCTALERLRMMHCRGKLSRVRVQSPSLKIFSTDGSFGELFIEDAPNLEWVLGEYMRMRIGVTGYKGGVHLKVVHAPKLELLGYLGMSFRGIEIGETIFTDDHIRVKTLMPSLKTLAIEVSYTSGGYINWIMKLLELFPCLETLYIRSDTWSAVQAAAPETWDVLRSVPSVDNHLEKVVFEVYRGHEWQRNMAKFLHGRSSLLKAMEFHCMSDDNTKDYGEPLSVEWVRKEKELLCLDSRASMDARFLFFKHQLGSYLWHYHDERSWCKRNYYSDLYDVLIQEILHRRLAILHFAALFDRKLTGILVVMWLS